MKTAARHHCVRSKIAIINKTNNSRCLEPFRETVSLTCWWQEYKLYSRPERSPVLNAEGFSLSDSENCIFSYLNLLTHVAKWFHWHISRNWFLGNNKLVIKLHIINWWIKKCWFCIWLIILNTESKLFIHVTTRMNHKPYYGNDTWHNWISCSWNPRKFETIR